MFAMAIDYKARYFALKDKEDEQVRADVADLKKMVAEHNTKHETDMNTLNATVSEIANQTKATNGKVLDHEERLKGVEKIIGRKINFNDPQLLKTARIIFISTAVIVVVVLAGGDGLTRLLEWLPGA